MSEKRLVSLVAVRKRYSGIRPQPVDELCMVPWGHHRYIINKHKEET